eukprot:TRINITY_DN10268_c0_g1_i1.p1 TRINITY_DN10268_c0_g1~~TRINITY_DN10268_c0_g1_i1.p1  ORF type:complete len:516 (-),score=131.71 TRINITY_DN10268_c0_g1_i1:12-1559(-)
MNFIKRKNFEKKKKRKIWFKIKKISLCIYKEDNKMDIKDDDKNNAIGMIIFRPVSFANVDDLDNTEEDYELYLIIQTGYKIYQTEKVCKDKRRWGEIHEIPIYSTFKEIEISIYIENMKPFQKEKKLIGDLRIQNEEELKEIDNKLIWKDFIDQDTKKVVGSLQMMAKIRYPFKPLTEQEKDKILVENKYLYYFLFYQTHLDKIIAKEKIKNVEREELMKVNTFGYPVFNLTKILKIMKSDSQGITTCERKITELDIITKQKILVVYTHSFSGIEATKWLQKVLGCDERDALLCGQRMLKEKYIRHETNSHGFRNSDYYYVFNDFPHHKINERKKSTENSLKEEAKEISNLSFAWEESNIGIIEKILRKEEPDLFEFNEDLLIKSDRNSFFLTFLESEYSEENLYFFLDSVSYASLKEEKERSEKACLMFHQYVKISPINISSKQLNLIQENYKLFPIDLFDSAKEEVFENLRDPFRRFLQSKEFKIMMRIHFNKIQHKLMNVDNQKNPKVLSIL